MRRYVIAVNLRSKQRLSLSAQRALGKIAAAFLPGDARCASR